MSKLIWSHGNLEPAIIIAQELFDALPVHQFEVFTYQIPSQHRSSLQMRDGEKEWSISIMRILDTQIITSDLF